MASGGGDARRLINSEPRNRSYPYARLRNYDEERGRSLNSMPASSSIQQEDRLNNWDFLNWQPSASFDANAKRPKRGNEEKEEKRRSMGNNASEDSSPVAEVKRHRTPSTFPRTKMTSSTSQQERKALENLRQQLTFSDADEQISTDGMDLGLGGTVSMTTSGSERNNERYMPPRRDRPALQMSLLERNEVGTAYSGASGGSSGHYNDSNMAASRRKTEPSRDNRNAASNLFLAEGEDNSDSTHIVGRLMQIRDYIKQSSSMLDKLQTSPNRGDHQKALQLEQVISRLKEQEQKYLELLLRLSTAKEEELMRRQNSGASSLPNGASNALGGESESEAATELEMAASDSSDNEEEPIENQTSGRPIIEDHLGRHSDTENETEGIARRSVPTTDLESTLVAETTSEAIAERQMLENDLESKSAELIALKQQHELLSKMLQQQEQLRALQSRQAQLMMLQQEAERRLEEERAGNQDGAASSGSSVTNNMDVPEGGQDSAPEEDLEDAADDDEEEEAGAAGGSNVRDSDSIIPQELRELRQRLDFLKNIYDISDEPEKANEDEGSMQAASEADSATPSSLLAMDKAQLEARLLELQSKKDEMDHLLVQLQRMRGGAMDQAETESNASSQARVSASIAATAAANRTEEDAQDMLEMLEARKKMQKLQEVRNRLDQLKGLVQYYQSGAEFIHGDIDEAPDAPIGLESSLLDEPSTTDGAGGVSSDRGGFRDAAFLQNLRMDAQNSVRDLLASALAEEGLSLGSALGEADRQSVGSMTVQPPSISRGSLSGIGGSSVAGNMSTGSLSALGAQLASSLGGDDNDSTSQMSSTLGAWGEDPQIQEKVRRLNEAKEKLHRLQDLVAMVQESPETAQHLPDDLDALTASMPAPSRDGGLPLTMASQGGGEAAGGLSLRDAMTDMLGGPSQASYDQAEMYYEQKMGKQRAEIERLMAERQKLLSLQGELQRLHDNMPNRGQREIAQQTSPHARTPTVDIAVETLNNQDYRGGASTSISTGGGGATSMQSPNNRQLAAEQLSSGTIRGIEPSPNNLRLASEGSRRAESSSQPGVSSAQQRGHERDVGVTFQEPLETVISNEEVYGRMRQQRMLREELREKKKELEDMMRKDKPKKQNFSRHQDNQSDNVSFSNRSDPFTDRASQDQTAATWGGSTADNLESIEEDAGDSGDGQQADEEVDDGYPSDGIVQVEEEEEANDDNSDDRDTYTIENDPYPSKMRTRRRDLAPPIIPSANPRRRTSSNRQGSSRGAPFQGAEASYNYWAPDNNQVLNNVRGSSSRTRTRRKNREEINALKEELGAVREQLSTLQEAMQNQNPVNQPINNEQGTLHNGLNYMASLQQQQMMLTMNQFQNNMSQQQEMMERLMRLERAMSDSCYGSTDVLDVRNRLNNTGGPPYSTMQQQINQPKVNNIPSEANGMPHYLDSYSSLYRQSRAMDNTSPYDFNFRPSFPRGFAQSLQPGAVDATSQSTSTRQSQYRRNVNNNQNNRLAMEVDQQRLAQVMQQESDIERSRGANPFRIPEYLLRGSPQRVNPFRQERLEDLEAGDDVAIETIRAVDMGESGDANLPLYASKSSRSDETYQQQGARPKQRSKKQASDNRKISRRRNDEAQVIGQRFPTPSRADAAAKLASQRVQSQRADYRPGLSAGISGAGFEDENSVVSSVPGAEDPLPSQSNHTLTADDDAAMAREQQEESGEFSMFEALRETIYSEVATLISQNECRPHYLIEMFRELQMLNTDYLRQRFLYCIQDLVTKYLTEESIKDEREQRRQERRAQQQQEQDLARWGTGPQGRLTSELTPSVSLSTADEEEIKAKIFRKTSKSSNTKEMNKQSDGQSQSQARSTRYDFMEPVETLSSISTPDSNHFESPFAQDSLGDTVIHLDKALQRMKEFEDRLSHSGTQTSPGAANITTSFRFDPSQQQQSSMATQTISAPAFPSASGVSHPRTSSRETSQLIMGAAAAEADNQSSSAMDNGSEGSISDIGTYPRIDTQQLDQQIKSIMTEIIPVLKEHMDDVCSQQLLLYIRRLVLSLTKQRDDEGQEFVRFFHKQLGSILQDSLAKFEGRKMRDCGEDLLVDLSEILFNELAFFRLMQDLDDPKARVKANLRNWHQGPPSANVAAREVMEGVTGGLLRHAELLSQSDEEESDSTESSEEEEEEEEEPVTGGSQVEKQDLERNKDMQEQNDDVATEDDEAELDSINNEEEEQLGKDRDDELAAQVNIAEDAKASMKITLAPSETKPMTRIGSDEDTEGDDAEYSNEDPSDTAVSHDYYHYNDDMRDPAPGASNQLDDDEDSEEAKSEAGGEEGEEAESNSTVVQNGTATEGSQQIADGVSNAEDEAATQKELESQDNEKDADTKENTTPSSTTSTNDSASLVNGQVLANGHVQHDEASAEVTLDDLPEKLSGLNQTVTKIAEGGDVTLKGEDVLEYVNSTIGNELAGDPNAIKDPETGSDSSRQV